MRIPRGSGAGRYGVELSPLVWGRNAQRLVRVEIAGSLSDVFYLWTMSRCRCLAWDLDSIGAILIGSHVWRDDLYWTTQPPTHCTWLPEECFAPRM